MEPPPPLNPAVIRRSLGAVTDGPQRIAGDFYAQLFASHPDLRGMFPPQMNNQNERLFAALLKVAELIDRPDTMSRYLGQLGADHRKYGVEPAHYAPVGTALLRALRHHSPEWGIPEDDAWGAAYSAAAQMMIHGAETAPGPARWDGEVIRHERRTADLAVITIRTDQPLPYQAGQYVTVQTGRWKRVWRPFSIANAPRRSGDSIDLHVRAIPGGWVSTALVKDTRAGGRLLVGPPMGEMTPAAANGRDMLCIAGGAGLAPLKALTESVLASDEDALAAGLGGRRNIILFHGARQPVDLYDMPALRKLADTYPWLQVVPVVSGDPSYAGCRGQVSEVALDYGDWGARHAFIAGPAQMIRRTAAELTAAGLPGVYYDAPELGIPHA